MTIRLAGLSAILALGAAPAFAQSLEGGPAQAYLYDFPNFQGSGVDARGEIPDLNRNNFNDKTTSLRIVSGRWEVCSGTGYTGVCKVVESDVWDMETLDLNNQLSSLRPVGLNYREDNDYNDPYDDDRYDDDRYDDDRYGDDRSPVYPGNPQEYPNYPTYPGNDPDYRQDASLTLYQFERFEGARAKLDGSARELDRYRYDNEARSLRVEGGEWRVCEDEDFRGRCAVVTRDVPDLDALGLSERISSVELIYDGPPRANYDRDPYDNPYGSRERLEGYKAGFFPNPPSSGYAADQCLRGSRQACEDFSDEFCQSVGYREAAWYTRDVARRDIRDVLCVRD